MTKWVYSFGPEKTEGRGAMKNLLGGKGANLAEMANLGLPVPPGFTSPPKSAPTSTPMAAPTRPTSSSRSTRRSPPSIGRRGHVFGDAANPLLVSVRSGARASMPGMMDTVLNLGLNDETVKALAKTSGDERFAYDSYRRFIQMYSYVVLERRSQHVRGDPRSREGQEGLPPRHRPHRRRLARGHRRLQGRRAEGDRQAVPAGPARPAVGRDRRGVRLVDERARDHLPPAATTFPATGARRSTCRRWCSATWARRRATGVAFTRNPSTGENELYGEFLVNAQGEDVVAGIRTPQNITEAARKAAGPTSRRSKR